MMYNADHLWKEGLARKHPAILFLNMLTVASLISVKMAAESGEVKPPGPRIIAILTSPFMWLSQAPTELVVPSKT